MAFNGYICISEQSIKRGSYMSIHVGESRDNELAELAYASVRNVPTLEPNDRNRLGYHVWLFLRGEISTVEGAVEQARSRFQPKTLPISEVATHIEEELKKLQNPSSSVSSEGVLGHV